MSDKVSQYFSHYQLLANRLIQHFLHVFNKEITRKYVQEQINIMALGHFYLNTISHFTF